MSKLCESNVKNRLAVSDKFKSKEQVVTYLFGIRKKCGHKFDKYYIKRKCVFDKSENEKIWFLKFTKDKDWKNELFNDGKIFKTTYIGNDLEYIAKKKRKEANENKNLLWYIFAKDKDNFYHFLGIFKRYKIDKNESFYKREPEMIFSRNRLDIIKNINRGYDTIRKGQVFRKK